MKLAAAVTNSFRLFFFSFFSRTSLKCRRRSAKGPRSFAENFSVFTGEGRGGGGKGGQAGRNRATSRIEVTRLTKQTLRARQEYDSISSSSLLDSSGIMSLNVATLRASVSDVSSGPSSLPEWNVETFPSELIMQRNSLRRRGHWYPRLITIICKLSPGSSCYINIRA